MVRLYEIYRLRGTDELAVVCDLRGGREVFPGEVEVAFVGNAQMDLQDRGICSPRDLYDSFLRSRAGKAYLASRTRFNTDKGAA
jgi:hypothetical protein